MRRICRLRLDPPPCGAEEETAGHTEVFRYDAGSSKLDCVSCTTTGPPSTGDSSLASDGLSLTDDGRVFFNSTDQLVPRRHRRKTGRL